MKQKFTTKNKIKLGDLAPDFIAVNKEGKDVKLSELDSKTKVILTVPAVDTKVCDFQIKAFLKKLEGNSDITLIVVSMDLPEVQKNWCLLNSADNLIMLSDVKHKDFAEKYGLKLKLLGVVGRSVIILDKDNKITYLDVCEKVSDHPNYEAAFESLSL